MFIADLFCCFCLYIVQSQLYVQSGHKHLFFTNISFYNWCNKVHREKSIDINAEALICGYLHKCNLKFCMQSHPPKPILSSMSFFMWNMQSVFRHHICWVSHISMKKAHHQCLPFLSPWFPCSLYSASGSRAASCDCIWTTPDIAQESTDKHTALNKPSYSWVSSFVFVVEHFITLKLV